MGADFAAAQDDVSQESVKNKYSLIYFVRKTTVLKNKKMRHYFEMDGRFSGRWELENDNFKSLTLKEIGTSSR